MSSGDAPQQQQSKAFVNKDEQRVNFETEHLLERFILQLLQREKIETRKRDIISCTICEVTKINDARVLEHETNWEKPIVDGLILMADDVHKRYKDEMDSLVEQVPPQCHRKIFVKVCMKFIERQKLHWGHVAILFYFAFRLILKAVDIATQNYDWIKTIFSWAVDFFREYLSDWIVRQGGWSMILKSLSHTNIPWFWIGVGSSAIILIALIVWWKRQD